MDFRDLASVSVQYFLMMQMLGVFAEFERTTIVERVVAGMDRATSEGRRVVGKVPYGYVRD